jgi:hypothetical protein
MMTDALVPAWCTAVMDDEVCAAKTSVKSRLGALAVEIRAPPPAFVFT